MAGCVHLMIGESQQVTRDKCLEVSEHSKFSSKELRVLKMRFSLAVAVVLLGISVSGLAQQNNTIKVKRSAPEKAPKKSAPIGTIASPATASGANAKQLQSLERQSARGSATSRSAQKRTAGTSAGLKPVKDRPNPPINFGQTGGGKNAGTLNQGANPYKGRLRQKRSR
jgi:hypothetical protein